MNLTKDQITNLIYFLSNGKFSVTADEALVLALLKQQMALGLKEYGKSPSKKGSGSTDSTG